ncbi:MAG: DUF4097 family beta strand repeat-containing protein [Sinimarinibacterium flocculans]|uniref:DUF4097 family beta strand repeat-containing protein n=1 Tax=Sinimarinibacterium flocculans TaxID=985250 RepID=UPI003C426FED
MFKQALTATALLIALPVIAATPIDERRPLAADGRVEVNNLAGLIEVVGWDENAVHLTGELGEDVEALEIEGDRERLSIHVRYPKKSRRSVEETMLRLRVPHGAALDLNAVSADVRVVGTRGDLHAASVSGDVDVRFDGERLRLNSVSGDVSVQSAATDSELRTVSGDVVARGLRGELKAETVSGDIDLIGEDFSDLAGETVSGDLQLSVRLLPKSRLRAESLSGDVRLRLVDTGDVRLSMKTFSGSLRGRPSQPVSGDQRSAEYTLGAGTARAELSTFSGDIVIER